jgi:hypothetical protein
MNTHEAKHISHWKGIAFAVAAAGLFGASTPFAKLLVGSVDPWMLAGLLYLGSGLGLAAWQLGSAIVRRRPVAALEVPRSEALWLAAAVLSGGVVGPALPHVRAAVDAGLDRLAVAQP